MHNEHKLVESLASRIKNGQNMALITDAGTPAISDPGFLLVRACIEADVPVSCLPGATAFVPALVNSGLPNDKFVFEGFLPPKKGRKKRLDFLAEEERTFVLYESPYKLVKTLTQLAENLGEDRKISVSRELTKIYEENVRGTLAEVIIHFEANPPKGELVLVVEGKSKKE
jgi:16S rRNA (cytidine1402-2'-O)-methyltransferase